MGETLRNSGRCKKNSQEIGEKVRDNHLSLRNSGRFKNRIHKKLVKRYASAREVEKLCEMLKKESARN